VSRLLFRLRDQRSPAQQELYRGAEGNPRRGRFVAELEQA